MDAFWQLARRMLRYRALLVTAILCSFLSAGGIAVGFAAVKEVLVQIQAPEAERKGLPDFATALNTQLADLHLGVQIPQTWIARLPDSPWSAVFAIVIGLGLLTVVGGAGQFLHAYLSLAVVHRTVTGIRRETFHRVLRLPLASVVSNGSSDIISRIVNDTTALAQGFNALISKAVLQAGRGAAGLIVALAFNWWLTCIALPAALIMYVVIRKLGKRIRRASRRALESQGRLYGSASEALTAMRVVKVHTTERYEAGRFHRQNKEVLRQLLRVRTARALASPLVEVLSIVGVGALALVATKAILDGKLEPLDVMFVLAGLGLAAGSLKPLTGLVNDIQASSGAAERIRALLEATPEPGHDASLPKLGRHAETIVFDEVTFTYPNADVPALKDVTLTVHHGETVAIVGPNGSGKTTLLAMVPRLFDPDSGSVTVDATDIRTVSVRSLRRQIGMVTQEVVVFAGTIADNIAYGAEAPTRKRIIEAATRARADEFIRNLPDGYDTVVGEHGATLSGGQRQRIAIARAVLRDPSILILDEATSMIDADSEAKIAEAVDEFSQGRTSIVVAHRLSTVLRADRIFVMERGRIIDEGSHDELLDRCETYRLLAQRQLIAEPKPRAAPAKP